MEFGAKRDVGSGARATGRTQYDRIRFVCDPSKDLDDWFAKLLSDQVIDLTFGSPPKKSGKAPKWKIKGGKVETVRGTGKARVFTLDLRKATRTRPAKKPAPKTGR